MRTRAPLFLVSLLATVVPRAAAECTPTLDLVSVSSAGVHSNSDADGDAVVSANGRFVVFGSYATNLVQGDANGFGDVFRHDRTTRVCTLVSATPAGASGNGLSEGAGVSANGRYVVFVSAATNLVSPPVSGGPHVFVRDMETGETTQADVSSSGVSGDAQALGARMDISDDGRFVAFASLATNLVAGDTNGTTDVFVRDRQNGVTHRASVDSQGVQGAYQSHSPALSADGRYVVFSSESVLAADVPSGWQQIYRRDLQTSETFHVSASDPVISPGNPAANQHCLWPDVSDDGRVVAFVTAASNLSALDTNIFADVYVRDTGTALTLIASDDALDAPGNDSSGLTYVALSGDGLFILFQSRATNFVPGSGGSNRADWFLREVHGTYLYSTSGAPAIVQPSAGSPGLSRDGSVASFASNATNLVAGDTNGAGDVFVRGCPPLPASAVAGDVAHGELADATDGDEVAVSCLAGMKLALSLASDDGALRRARVTVVGPDQEDIASRTLRLTSRGAKLTVRIAATGDHRVLIAPADGTFGTYTLRTSARLPAAAKTQNRTLRGPQPAAVTFLAYAGSTLDATLTPKGRSHELPSQDLGASLRSPSGAEIDLTSFLADGGNHRTTLTAAPLSETGVWTLVLGNLSTSAHKARVTLRPAQALGSSDVPIE